MRPPEQVKRDLVRQWLAKADEDLAVAETLVSQDAPYLTAIGFHAQQAAEKFLKAFLVRHQVEFPKTHDLDEILDIVATVDRVLAESLRCTIMLTPYAVHPRYPDEFPTVTAQDAKAAVSLAAKARDAILLSLREYLSGNSL